MKKQILISIITLFFSCSLFAQASVYTMEDLKSKFKHKDFTEKILYDFQKSMESLVEKPMLNEEIPGKIISWSTFIGRFAIKKTYIIQSNTLTEIEILPKDTAFLNQINSYVPEESRFAYSSDLWSFAYVSKQLENDVYIITAAAKSFSSYPEMPNDDVLNYLFEYKTKDFKQFQLVRLKESHNQDWIEVKH